MGRENHQLQESQGGIHRPEILENRVFVLADRELLIHHFVLDSFPEHFQNGENAQKRNYQSFHQKPDFFYLEKVQKPADPLGSEHPQIGLRFLHESPLFRHRPEHFQK